MDINKLNNYFNDLIKELYQASQEYKKSKIKAIKTNDVPKLQQFIVRTIPDCIMQAINDLKFKNNFDLQIKGSIGAGNLAQYPWIVIYNQNISDGASKGITLSILFDNKIEKFYLGIGQGIEYYKSVSKSKKNMLLNIDKVKNELYNSIINDYEEYKDEKFLNTILLNDIKHDNDKGYWYEKATVIAKEYQLSNISSFNFINDLTIFIKIYHDIINKLKESKATYEDFIDKIIGSKLIIPAQEAIVDINKVTKDYINQPIDIEPIIKEVTRKESLPKDKLKILNDLKMTKIDYLKVAQVNACIGLKGEEYALKYEIERVRQLGLDSNKVKHIAIQSDAYGYDIESIDKDDHGKEIKIYIEVKTTKETNDTKFFISRKEYETSKEKSSQYYIYRIYDVNSTQPKLYREKGFIEDNFDIDPYTYTAIAKYNHY